ncbi:hypothetical protein C4D60_Mb08t33720 [Musa balbisiana]|uniref:Uncharacterized protein n=1 Tax=Musa balbisiana TaxID=52838 RepID=A0A4S8K8F9_MUSBA|nr:hypothetical protein C4D60_Mb08t33720 [Musa balbisiana]
MVLYNLCDQKDNEIERPWVDMSKHVPSDSERSAYRYTVGPLRSLQNIAELSSLTSNADTGMLLLQLLEWFNPRLEISAQSYDIGPKPDMQIHKLKAWGAKGRTFSSSLRTLSLFSSSVSSSSPSAPSATNSAALFSISFISSNSFSRLRRSSSQSPSSSSPSPPAPPEPAAPTLELAPLLQRRVTLKAAAGSPAASAWSWKARTWAAKVAAGAGSLLRGRGMDKSGCQLLAALATLGEAASARRARFPRTRAEAICPYLSLKRWGALVRGRRGRKSQSRRYLLGLLELLTGNEKRKATRQGKARQGRAS